MNESLVFFDLFLLLRYSNNHISFITPFIHHTFQPITELMKHSESFISGFYEQQQWLFSLIQSKKRDHKPTQPKKVKSHAEWLAYYSKRTNRIRGFLRFAGYPERQYNAVHVAGTSGKGSVTTMMAALLTQCGLRTGHTISPYLQLPTEKLICDGRLIRPSEFAQLIGDFRLLYDAWLKQEGAVLRYGDAWTLLKFLWLAKRKVDWAVIETAVGGRYDRSNVVPAKLAVITNVDYDHVKSLGPALTDIARHKAGIIKEGQLAITAATHPDVLEIIRAEAREKGAALYCLGHEFDYTVDEMNRLSVQTPFNSYQDIQVKANGTYQLQNAALSIAALDLLAQHHAISLTQAHTSSALGQVTYPGRMEIVSQAPLIILDGAHNPAKIRALVHSLQTSYPDKQVTVILGVLGYKDVKKIVRNLRKITKRFITTEPHLLGKRATPAHLLADMVQKLYPDVPITSAEYVYDAIEQAKMICEPNDLIIITGSLYLVGEARSYWYPVEQLLKESEQGLGLIWG